MQYKYVVTHGGRCHRDELYALGLLAVLRLISSGLGRFTDVYRREPTEEEFQHERVLVLDVGSRYQPEKSNIDHHGFPRGTEECSLSLLAKLHKVPAWMFEENEVPFEDITFQQLWEDAPWYKAVVLQDCLGIGGLAKRVGLDEIPEELISGVESFVLSSIGRMDRVDPYWLCFVQDLVWSKVVSALQFRRKMKELAEKGHMYSIADELDASAFDANQMGPFGINQYIERLDGKENVWITISGDPRTKGICLYRTQYGLGKLDFSQLEGEHDVTFAHKGGFMCIVAAGTPIDRLMELARRAIL